MADIGHRRWAIAEGYIPGQSVSQDHALVSHEAVCLLNAGLQDAEIDITLFSPTVHRLVPIMFRSAHGARFTCASTT